MSKKFRVLLAEDEADIRRALIEVIDSHPLFEVTGWAVDGQDALSQLETGAPPDLLITDIRMPGMDGLELIRRARQRHVLLRSVIVSGYDRFEYAQKAIKYGVCDYILKPVLPANCLNMLSALAREMLADAPAYDLTLALSRRQSAPPPVDAPLYLLAASIGNFPFAPSEAKRDDQMLQQLCEPFICPAPGFFCYGTRAGLYYLLFHADTDARAQQILSEADRAIGAVSQSRTLALSCCLQDADVYAAGARLYNQIRQGAVLLNSRVIDLNAPYASPTGRQGADKLFHMDEDMVNAIRFRDYPAYKGLLRDRFAQWEREQLSAAALLDYVKFQYVYAGQQLFSDAQRNGTPISYDWEKRLAQAFSVCDSWDGLFDAVFCLFHDLFNAYESPDAPRRIPMEIESYILNHYAERITNQSLARHFGFVPSYISKLFKAYKGISPCEYLTQVRIEHAQRMLRQSENPNLSEISAKLGFSDSSYFGKLFKKQVGLTPSEYKTYKPNKLER